MLPSYWRSFHCVFGYPHVTLRLVFGARLSGNVHSVSLAAWFYDAMQLHASPRPEIFHRMFQDGQLCRYIPAVLQIHVTSEQGEERLPKMPTYLSSILY